MTDNGAYRLCISPLSFGRLCLLKNLNIFSYVVVSVSLNGSHICTSCRILSLGFILACGLAFGPQKIWSLEGILRVAFKRQLFQILAMRRAFKVSHLLPCMLKGCSPWLMGPRAIARPCELGIIWPIALWGFCVWLCGAFSIWTPDWWFPACSPHPYRCLALALHLNFLFDVWCCPSPRCLYLSSSDLSLLISARQNSASTRNSLVVLFVLFCF